MRLLFVLSFSLAACAAAGPGDFTLANDKLELTIAASGGAMTRLVLKGDTVSPFGEAATLGRPVSGHFVCVDGFGPVSEEERAAGLPRHGEVHAQPWEKTLLERHGKLQCLRFTVQLPMVHETFTRELRLADGETVIAIASTLESHLGFDRPINWGEHPSLAAPFLEPGKVVVDLAGRRSRTRPHPSVQNGAPRRLASARDFTWPMAPTVDGGTVDIRSVPLQPNSLDHTATLLERGSKPAFVTALHTGRHYLIGYLFRPEEYPWVQDWQNYPPDGRMFRGIEFATQPFDVPRREAIQLNRLFDAPVYRWLPAKSKISSRFLMFWTRTPEGMTRVDDVRLENGTLVIEDRAAGKRITLAASTGLD